ncbi:HAD family hydrolase [Chitinophaga pinensis]|uniref:HAD-superfamily hydrolase, subfamily IA, variant 3 n=1 Tax=Chitinophaga pinensis (strain ATCC 43595 / DSM 2588 / LMG 13176 / NBRC 15968 / NCIMB 11800 / UQM 2034) TaxID=485918 RepID=A0A979GSS4_CHIPD|nr:HAD family phosphatase [Chitinophaga pinensis]ACU58145.1 HAD-superfamily hydrolase, subfamily IA, variant 3 [Chitinophaga pinensis DSM 2588]
MKGIKHIIFDLGGVIINLDYQLTYKAFEALGVKEFTSLYNQFSLNALFDDLETGKIAPDVFLDEMQKHTAPGTTHQQIIDAWNAMLLDFPLRRLQILQQLRQHYGLYLLSNTNEIHMQAFNKILEESRGIPSLAAFFDKAYYSHQIGLRKPFKESFQFVLDENGLDPAETLFIDDTLPNIEGAKVVGLQTIHLLPPKTMADIFK